MTVSTTSSVFQFRREGAGLCGPAPSSFILPRMKNRTLLIASLALSLLCAAFTYQAQTNKPQWEYKVELHGTISEKKLNELAGQGWELVATASPGDQYQPATFIFRRERVK